MGISADVVEGRQWLVGEPRVSRVAGGGVRVVAPAKINLTLWVGGRREDGYHPVESIVGLISLVDRLSVYPGGRGCELTCSEGGLACDESNLVIRAARAFARRAGREANLRLHLEKSIPIGAGLGGGSSDAAACLLALTTLWKTGYDDRVLTEIGAELGSDVPLFLNGPMSMVRGRGELVEGLGFGWPFWAVLAVPERPLGTAEVYEKFDELLTVGSEEGKIDGRRLGLYRPAGAGAVMFNMLSEPAFALMPELEGWRASLLGAGAKHVQISGSGSALFCLFNSLGRARSVVGQLSSQFQSRSWIVHGGHY